jgi:hypothetical protein
MGVLSDAAKYENTVIKRPSASYRQLPETTEPLNVMIFRDPDDRVSVRCAVNYSGLLKKYRAPFQLLDVGNNVSIPDDVNCLILTMTDLGVFPDYNSLFSYAKRGGTVIFASPPVMNSAFKSISGTLGITEYTAGKSSDFIVDCKGVEGPPETSYSYKEMVLCSVAARLRSVCEIYLKDESGNPLLWRIGYGSGNLYVSNSNIISSPYRSGRNL